MWGTLHHRQPPDDGIDVRVGYPEADDRWEFDLAAPAVHHVMNWSPFIRRDAEGAVSNVAGLAAAEGDVLWGGPLGPHSLENVRDTLLHIVSIEIQDGGVASGPPRTQEIISGSRTRSATFPFTTLT